MRLHIIRQDEVLRAFAEAFDLLNKYKQQGCSERDRVDTASKIRQVLLENRAAYASGKICPTCNGTGRA